MNGVDMGLPGSGIAWTDTPDATSLQCPAGYEPGPGAVSSTGGGGPLYSNPQYEACGKLPGNSTMSAPWKETRKNYGVTGCYPECVTADNICLNYKAEKSIPVLSDEMEDVASRGSDKEDEWRNTMGYALSFVDGNLSAANISYVRRQVLNNAAEDPSNLATEGAKEIIEWQVTCPNNTCTQTPSDEPNKIDLMTLLGPDGIPPAPPDPAGEYWRLGSTPKDGASGGSCDAICGEVRPRDGTGGLVDATHPGVSMNCVSDKQAWGINTEAAMVAALEAAGEDPLEHCSHPTDTNKYRPAEAQPFTIPIPPPFTVPGDVHNAKGCGAGVAGHPSDSDRPGMGYNNRCYQNKYGSPAVAGLTCVFSHPHAVTNPGSLDLASSWTASDPPGEAFSSVTGSTPISTNNPGFDGWSDAAFFPAGLTPSEWIYGSDADRVQPALEQPERLLELQLILAKRAESLDICSVDPWLGGGPDTGVSVRRLCKCELPEEPPASATPVASPTPVAPVSVATQDPGVPSWIMATQSVTCDATCSAAGQSCHDGDWGIHNQATMAAAIESQGLDAANVCQSYAIWHSTIDPTEAPPFARTADGKCFYPGSATSSTCSDTLSYGERLCKCE